MLTLRSHAAPDAIISNTSPPLGAFADGADSRGIRSRVHGPAGMLYGPPPVTGGRRGRARSTWR